MNWNAAIAMNAKLVLVLAVTAGCENVGSRPTGQSPVAATSSRAESAVRSLGELATRPTPGLTLVSHRELPDGVVTEVRGMRVVSPVRESEGSQMRAFNWSAGTSVAVWVWRPEGGILGLDRDASEISAFQDDRGTDLWSGSRASKFSHSQLDMMPRISEDGSAILFEVNGQGVPRQGATTLTLRGEVRLLVASKKASFTAEDVTLKSGTEFTVGQRTIKVTKTGAPSFGDAHGFAATLRLQGDVADIAKIAFRDDQGNDLQAKRQGSYWSGSGESRINNWEYVLEKQPHGPVQVVLTSWIDLTKQAVPLDLTFGAGL